MLKYFNGRCPLHYIQTRSTETECYVASKRSGLMFDSLHCTHSALFQNKLKITTPQRISWSVLCDRKIAVFL